jgi:dTDP-glucose 4,6-dehydratase
MDKRIPVYGSGENVREWIHVSDHCEAIDLALHKGLAGETYNVGSGNERSNLQIIKQLCKIFDKKFEDIVEFVEDRKGHDFRYALDSTKIKEELGWQPNHIPFHDRLAHTVEWYRHNEDWWRGHD